MLDLVIGLAVLALAVLLVKGDKPSGDDELLN